MSGIVVLDQVDVEFLGRLAIDLFQESQPFDMSVARLGACDQFAFHGIEGGKQCDRAMPGGRRAPDAVGPFRRSTARLGSVSPTRDGRY